MFQRAPEIIVVPPPKRRVDPFPKPIDRDAVSVTFLKEILIFSHVKVKAIYFRFGF